MNQDKINKLQARLKEIVTFNLHIATQDIQKDFWLITVNKAVLSVDWRYLDIFVSSIKNQDKLTKTLAIYAQDLKREINNKLMMRITPIVRFRYDDEMERTTNMLVKLNNLSDELKGYEEPID